jgi:hypothetical protein
MKRAALLLFSSLLSSAALADELRMTTLLRGGDMTVNAGRAGIAVRDVVGDSRAEIVTCAARSAHALAYDGVSAYREAWYSQEVGCAGVAVADVNGDGSNEVIVGAADTNATCCSERGLVYLFDPTGNRPPLASVQLSATLGVNAIAVGNVDNDAAIEIVAVTDSSTYVLDAATLAVQWTAGWGGTSVAIGDLEGNGLAEVIVNGSDGHVLDAATQTYKWGYIGGFGTVMTAGDADNDGKAEIVGGTSSQVRVVHGDTFTVDTFSADASSGVTVADANSDGQLEIIASPYYSTIRGFSATGTQLWSTFDASTFNSGLTAVGDPDGDGVTELVWGDFGRGGLVVGRANVNSTEWRGWLLRGFEYQLAAGDLDGDGDAELVAGSTNTLIVRDARSGATVGNIPVPGTSQRVWRVAIGQLDADAANEIAILSGTTYGAAALYVYDGVTYALQYNSDFVFGTMLLAIRNLDADAVDEIVLGSYSGNKLQVMNGTGGFLQQNITLANAPRDVAIGDLDGDNILDLAVTTDYSAYVFRTSDWLERKKIVPPTYGYSAPPVAIMPGQLAIFWPYDKLRTYDGTTLDEVRACTLMEQPGDLAYVTFGGRTRIASSEDKVRFYLTDGATCPAETLSTLPKHAYHLSFADVTGDGRPELLHGAYNSFTVASLAWNDELHGDADADGISTDGDIDALASYLYGSGGAFHPGADVNGDATVRPDDLFYLINYRKGTGAPPP